MKLLNPGPVSASDFVRKSLLQIDLCHREIEFEQLHYEVQRRIESVYDKSDNHYAVMIGGSGTLAVEAMLASTISQNDKALVLANGVYGCRIEDILKRHSKKFGILNFGLTGKIDFNQVEKELSSNIYTKIILVHHETTTGRLNDLKTLSVLAHKYQVGVLLDAVSSFGAESINFQDDRLLGVASSANKCLHGLPGLSFVLIKKDYISKLKGNACSLYLDLFNHYQNQHNCKVAFTPPVQLFYALKAALIELEKRGGWKNRQHNYQVLSDFLRDKFRQFNIKMVIPENESASMLTAFYIPDWTDYNKLHAYFKKNGYVIYSGQSSLADEIFRIATMGELNINDIDKLSLIMEDYQTTVFK